MNKAITIVFLLLTVLSACMQKTEKPNDVIVAQAAGKVLLKSELVKDYPLQNVDKNDSLAYINDYINKWIKQQLLVAEAERVLKPDELNIQKELELYRQELIIHKYKNKRVSALVDADLAFSEIEEYYNKHLKTFTLNYPIVTVDYIIFPEGVEISNNNKRKLLDISEDADPDRDDFIFRHARKYDNFNNNWIYFHQLLNQIAYPIEQPEAFLKKNVSIEFEKDNEQHIIVIKSYYLSGETAPIEFVSPQIKSLLVNNKKLDFLREIKDSLYNNGLKYNKFTVFNK
ncbi:hypothetical protein [Roseimarinus sediminis]|jgi:hypothetical protein|uniref:hypothetical protein n=1 Tax=Roseimarinus sediminis TaxID=1610899 RepID=UPI003D21705C